MDSSTTEEPGLKRAELCLTTEYVAPVCETGQALVEIWQDILDLDQVGINDDFFEIGGDSLGATIIAGNIESRFGCRFSPSQLVEAATVAAQLAIIGKQKETAKTDSTKAVPSHMIMLHENGTKPPLFLVHGGRGMSLYDRRFLEGLDKDRPVVFIDAIGFDGKEKTPETIEKTAARYLEGVLKIAPEGPLFLAATCSGSIVILEMARQSQKSGRPVDKVMMVDPLTSLFEDPYLAGIKGYRKILSRKLLTAQIRYYLRRLKRKLGIGEVAEFEGTLEQKAELQSMIKKRMSNRGDEDGSPSLLNYNSDAIFETQEAYRRAIGAYLPKRWEGEVHMLITEPRSGGIPIIREILPNATVQMTPYVHKQLFSEGIPDILKFLEER